MAKDLNLDPTVFGVAKLPNKIKIEEEEDDNKNSNERSNNDDDGWTSVETGKSKEDPEDKMEDDVGDSSEWKDVEI